NFMLGIKYWKSIDKKIKIRGKIITIAISIFLFAALLEIFIPLILVIVLARILIMIYAIVYYIGFIFPTWAEKFFLRMRDSEQLEESKELKDDAQEFLKILSQRRDVTAKEVTFYREKKICLVCKGKVGGFNNYICTKCDAIYCEKCARALTQLENSCWACSEAIDKSKPVRQIESEEEVKALIKSVEFQKKPKK
ncbi:MAG: DC1 domain-containing protein, partial [Promethearchaeota archaeon]